MRRVTFLKCAVVAAYTSLLCINVFAFNCYAVGERCMGAPGFDFVEWRCCENGGTCDETRQNDWGKFCRAADSSGSGQCASGGQKCGGAEGFDYVEPKSCCSATDECREAPNLGWGLHCVERLYKSTPPEGKGIIFPQSYPSITKEFKDGVDFNSWYFSDGYSNGQPFNNGWSMENHRIENEALVLDLKKKFFPSVNGDPSYPYTGAELSSGGFYGEGCYSVCMRPSGVSGVSSSFYVHAGEFDVPPGLETDGVKEMNEIDIEFVGKDTTRVQTNFFRRIKDANANSGSGHEQMIDLGFDASEDFHSYAFRWTAEGATWYVDGREVRTVSSREKLFPDPSYSTLRIRANIWAVNKQAEEWAGPLDQEFEATSASYKWIKFVEGTECQVESSC